jgi:hypothetical protein
MRNLQAVDEKAVLHPWKRPGAGDDHRIAIDEDLDIAGVDAREGDENSDAPLGLEDIHGRLPGREASLGTQPKELAAQSLCALQHAAGIRPHPAGRIDRRHQFFPLTVALAGDPAWRETIADIHPTVR